MIGLQAYLEQKLRGIISACHADDIYAISFFVCTNESYEYGGVSNVTEFSVGYQTERDCRGAGELSEERWNCAFWRQEETPVIKVADENEGMKILFDWDKKLTSEQRMGIIGLIFIPIWLYQMMFRNLLQGRDITGFYDFLTSPYVLLYRENGIQHIGYEDPAACYDHEMRYIGKGPVGYWELLCEITAVARKLQVSGFIKTQFGKPIPIIIHDLEYPRYCMEATARANPNGEADTFFAAMKRLGFGE